MSPKPDISEERREQILEAATSVFSERGMHQARMDDIAAESGVSKGLLYWYFKSKDEIIVAIAERMFSREMSALTALAAQEGSAAEQLRACVDLMVFDVARLKPLLPLLYEFFSMILREKATQEIMRTMIQQFFADMKKIIQRGIDQGEFRQVNVHDTVVALGAVIEGTYLIWAYDPELVDIEKHIRSGAELIIEGLDKC
jgi:AcrR family transcriptional regulator